jgi:hypothetical protein
MSLSSSQISFNTQWTQAKDQSPFEDTTQSDSVALAVVPDTSVMNRVFLGSATLAANANTTFDLYSFTDMAVKALADYPIKISNKDSGKIHTEVVNNPYNELFVTFPEKIDLPERFRYSLKLSIANITEKDDDTLVRIRVTKELEKFHDFYTGWMPYGSDGIEEKLVLYRIQHLIEMEKRFTKQQQQQ